VVLAASGVGVVLIHVLLVDLLSHLLQLLQSLSSLKERSFACILFIRDLAFNTPAAGLNGATSRQFVQIFFLVRSDLDDVIIEIVLSRVRRSILLLLPGWWTLSGRRGSVGQDDFFLLHSCYLLIHIYVVILPRRRSSVLTRWHSLAGSVAVSFYTRLDNLVLLL